MAIADYLRKLVELKNQLVANLKSMGVTADESEKLNTLVPKVLECKTEQNVEWVDSPSDISNTFYYGIAHTKKLIVPEGITTINYNNSYSYTNLEELYLPSTLTKLDYYSVFRSNSLKKITYPAYTDVETTLKNLFSISTIPISEATILLSASEESTVGKVFYENRNISNVIIKNGLLHIGFEAFYNCSNLISVTIPNTVTHISGKAFGYCNRLNTLIIPGNIDNANWAESNTFIGCEAIKKVIITNESPTIYSIPITQQSTLISSYIEEVEISEGVTCISGYADNTNKTKSFCQWTKLKKITIPDTVTSISGTYAFWGCTSLEDITIPNSVTELGVATFQNCTSLKSIVIPDSVRIIGEWLFADCTSLKSITIPENITSIGYCAFYNCTSLANIYYTGTEEQWNAITKATNWNYSMGSKVSGGTVIHYNYTG